MSKKTYLITGGSGFIGSHLIENLLNKGHKVINLDNFHDFYDYKIKIKNTLESVDFSGDFKIENNKNSDLKNLVNQTLSKNYQLIVGDIRDKELLNSIFTDNNIDSIVHIAALAGVRPSIENPLEYQDVNINGTMNLWEMCKKYNVKKFVCASSSSVYGNNKKVPFEETDIVDFAISPYAATKKAGEVLGHVYHSLYGIDMIQLRFFTVYGPRQRPDLAIHKFTKLISENKEIPFFGDGSTARDYTYIEDIIDGVLKSIKYVEENKNVYEILNLGESEVITLKKMVSTLEETLGLKAKINYLPMQPGDVNQTNANINKARELIGYNPKTSFTEGIKKFVLWFNNEKHDE